MIKVPCTICGASFMKLTAEVNRSTAHCCSRRCKLTFMKQQSHAYHGKWSESKASALTLDDLRGQLHYDEVTGVFTRIAVAHSSHAKVGDQAGYVDAAGYVRVFVLGRQYKAHRLAWFYLHGAWPAGEIDHIDSNKQNNAASNLRDVPKHINQQNRKRSTRSVSGLLGVTSSSDGSRNVARIRIGGTTRHLGSFRTADEAHEAYVDAKRLNHPGNTL